MRKPPCFDELNKGLSGKPSSFSIYLLSSSGLQNENLQNMEGGNQEMDLSTILLDSNEISMTVINNNVNEPYISHSS